MNTASIDIRLLRSFEGLSYYYALASYCVFQGNGHLDAIYAQKHFALNDFSQNTHESTVTPSRSNAKLVVKVGPYQIYHFSISYKHRYAKPS